MDRLIIFSIKHKVVVALGTLALIVAGIYSVLQLPIDAVPDITNNQVQVITLSPALAPQEVEQYITTPIELMLGNIQRVEEIRSISRFGLSVITVVFDDDLDIYLARQLVAEKLLLAKDNIPPGVGNPELMPVTTGLGEIYQYTLKPQHGYEDRFSPTELRTIQDWIVKRQLVGVPGVVEISSFGGEVKQYEVAIDPEVLNGKNITLVEVFDALAASNANSGANYIEKKPYAYYIRGEGALKTLDDIGLVVVKNYNGQPILVRDVASVRYGSAPRFGALSQDGEGEVAGGIVLMLKGENSYEVTSNIKARMAEIQKSLPEGLEIVPYLDRTDLVGRAISTVGKNLIEGGLIVVFVLVLLLGNLRAGLVVASVIPLSLLFALTLMNLFGVSANLMSLGAIDFGLIVDGAVIIVEAIVHRLHHYAKHHPDIQQKGKFRFTLMSRAEVQAHVQKASTDIRQSAQFGEVIILIVYLPLLALVGIEGKMFKPMAQTVSFAILGALILSLTYVPMMSALVLGRKVSLRPTFADRMMAFAQRLYSPMLNGSLRRPVLVTVVAVALFAVAVWGFARMGGEFIPTLEEGDFAVEMALPPGSSLSQSLESGQKAEKILMGFPEVKTVVTKIGASEVPTDPMPIERADIMVILKDKDEWTTAKTRDELADKMADALSVIPGVAFDFQQPIQMRFNELMTGAKSDVAVKIFGDDLNLLAENANRAAKLISSVEGVVDVKVEQVEGMKQVVVRYRPERMAQYGVSVEMLNTYLRTAFAGSTAGVIYEGERRFDLTVRLLAQNREQLSDVAGLYVPLPGGGSLPMSELADVVFESGPLQVSHDNTKRRVVVGFNVRGRDVESVVADVQALLEDRQKLPLPTGYYLHYGGQFENLQHAKARLSVAVPVALALILMLLYFTFGSIVQALLIFSAIPLAAIGGVAALWLRDMPFSISAGVGFIALFGVAVLNGIVLIMYYNQLRREGWADVLERIRHGSDVRLRPVLMTATVAALGFLPMAISNAAGAEVQKPLATVVIGGLVTSTLLTLLVLPAAYYLVERRRKSPQAPLLGKRGFPQAPLLGKEGLGEVDSPQNIDDDQPQLHS